MNYPLHSLANSLTQFISDELAPIVDASDEGKQKDLATLSIHHLDEFARQMLKVGEMLKGIDETAERQTRLSDVEKKMSDGGINTLHILSESLTVCLEDSLQRIISDAPDGPDKEAAGIVIERIEEFITTLNITANTLT